MSAGVEPAARPRRALLFVPLAAFGLLAAVFAYVFWLGGDPSAIPSALIGRPAPNAPLPALEGLVGPDGKPVPGLPAGELRSGKVTVVNVFASWCAPCREEHPVLEAFAAGGKARLVGINYKDDPENARRFLGRLGNPYAAVGVDAKGRAAIDWGVYGVPETFVVGGDGTIRYKIVGPLSQEALETVLKPEVEKAAVQ
ncbi:DsbE family thiol:disulfide interchange protein [Labrys wisconsinensis]|uniref:Cytochrome c biogenesis protein CcmG/thiol:disulfide interchange protein DsbE n=1 Tax=Labrys wisconsinensis TaxID=425677 RepID=A0ABU0J1Y5_9HYPH|nr:DsbE family thiol:disulfide interchange protein [Labrys wisconsinensis]MDQ0468265.1 cytochrome c biogenesis protein CcmG/thiol:disulfide interchange protein DsbE [Labrys wisconsinensis]